MEIIKVILTSVLSAVSLFIIAKIIGHMEPRGRFSWLLLLYKLLLIFLKTVLFGTVFFTLRSVVLDFVMVFINQIAYKYKLITLVFKAFKNCRKRLGGVVGVIMKKHNRAVFYLTCHPLADTVRGGVFFPVKRITIRYKSKEFSFSF